MRHNFRTGSLIAVFVPPRLSALVRAKQSGFCVWGVREFRAAVLAAGLMLNCICHHAVSPAEGLDGIDGDAQGIGYGCVGSLIFTHG